MPGLPGAWYKARKGGLPWASFPRRPADHPASCLHGLWSLGPLLGRPSLGTIVSLISATFQLSDNPPILRDFSSAGSVCSCFSTLLGNLKNTSLIIASDSILKEGCYLVLCCICADLSPRVVQAVRPLGACVCCSSPGVALGAKRYRRREP